MQQLSRTCMVVGHKQKVIEYVCTDSLCQQSRFLCSKCALEFSHKHEQLYNSHIVDNREFYERIKNKLVQAKDKYQQNNNDIEDYIVPLKYLIQEIQNQLNKIQNIIQYLEQSQLQNINIDHLEIQLLNIYKYGFNEIDDQSLNILINIPEKQQDLVIYKQLEDQSNTIIQNALKIKEWRLSKSDKQIQLSQKIKKAKYQIQQMDNKHKVLIGAISNNLKYIVSGSDKLKIWDYQSNELIKQLKLNDFAVSCKFTEDSTLLYAGSKNYIYQFDVNNQFNELYKQKIHDQYIFCIYCITNKIILTSPLHETIIKTDVDKNQQLLKIQGYQQCFTGLDYNKSRNIIAGSERLNQSIKLWNGNDGSLIIQKLNAHNNEQSIKQVFFIMNNDQLISLSSGSILIIWNINYKTKQLEQLQLIKNIGYNISLVLEQQFLIATGEKFIKVFSIQGDFVRQFYHEVDQFSYFNTTQLDSMKAVLIKGENSLQVCQIDMD